MHKAERREQKRKRAWYKEHMHSNRKSLEVIIQAQRDRHELYNQKVKSTE